MENDPRQIDDVKGPNGAKRLRVKLGDFDSDFDELFEEDELEATVAAKKKSSLEQVQAMAQQVTRGHEQALFSRGEKEDAEEARDLMQTDFLQAISVHGSGAMVASAGALDDVNVKDLADTRGRGTKKR